MHPTIEETSTAFIHGYVDLTAKEQRLAQASYRLLAAGRPAPPAAIAERAGWAVADVEERLEAADEWTRQHPGTFSLPVADAFEVARRQNAAVSGAVVGAERGV